MRDDQQRLKDILEAIERIQRRAGTDRKEFDRNELLQVWIVHHLQIIGEAARGVTEATRDSIPEIPWKQIVGMRHILVHHYFGIDLETVWSVVEGDLESLKASLQQVLNGANE
jgi:uncharacterized protein with HEPN domain